MNRDRELGLRDSPDSEIANNDFIYSMSRPLRLTASGRHLSEIMSIIIQLFTAQVQGWSQQATLLHFSVKLADQSQQQGGNQL